MQKVEDGMFVSVAYTGTLDNGDVFDTSEGRQPLEFKTGAGQLIKGFEDAVMGMSLNEKKEFTLGLKRPMANGTKIKRTNSPEPNFPTVSIPKLATQWLLPPLKASRSRPG